MKAKQNLLILRNNLCSHGVESTHLVELTLLFRSLAHSLLISLELFGGKIDSRKKCTLNFALRFFSVLNCNVNFIKPYFIGRIIKICIDRLEQGFWSSTVVIFVPKAVI